MTIRRNIPATDGLASRKESKQKDASKSKSPSVIMCLRQSQRNLRLDAGRKQLAAKLAKLKAEAAGGGPGGGDSGEYGISWGFDEDAVAEEEDDDGDGGENNDDEVWFVCRAREGEWAGGRGEAF